MRYGVSTILWNMFCARGKAVLFPEGSVDGCLLSSVVSDFSTESEALHLLSMPIVLLYYANR